MIGKLLLLLSVGCLAFAPLQNHKAEEDAQTIEGNWIAVSAELGGDKLPGEYLKDVRLILTAGRYTFQIDQGTYKLLPAEEPNAPKAMDITGVAGPNKGKTFLAIYEMAGDTVKICYDLEGKSRPKELASRAGTQQLLAIYKEKRRKGARLIRHEAVLE